MKKNDNFIRSDDNPGAILNTDNAALSAYKAIKRKEKKIMETDAEVKTLKAEVKDIKKMLTLILEKLQ